MLDIEDRFEGCLVGGAAGDALGYAVEFDDYRTILMKHGPDGIAEYELVDGVARFSDDTQMTLFTADGLLACADKEEGTCLEDIAGAYRDWRETQVHEGRRTASGLADKDELNVRRAPGSTCMTALASEMLGTIDNPINDSKGCGGIMRTAPIGLFFDPDKDKENEVMALAAEASALTHGHPLGYIPSAMFARIVQLLAYEKASTISEAVERALEDTGRMFGHEPLFDTQKRLICEAQELAASAKGPDEAAIRKLGEGWVAEETLAIAVYCALRYPGSFDAAIRAAVNHSGDSDSTGAVAGNILGASLGLSGIPAKYMDKIELRELLIQMADRLAEHAGK